MNADISSGIIMCNSMGLIRERLVASSHRDLLGEIQNYADEYFLENNCQLAIRLHNMLNF